MRRAMEYVFLSAEQLQDLLDSSLTNWREQWREREHIPQESAAVSELELLGGAFP